MLNKPENVRKTIKQMHKQEFMDKLNFDIKQERIMRRYFYMNIFDKFTLADWCLLDILIYLLHTQKEKITTISKLIKRITQIKTDNGNKYRTLSVSKNDKQTKKGKIITINARINDFKVQKKIIFKENKHNSSFELRGFDYFGRDEGIREENIKGTEELCQFILEESSKLAINKMYAQIQIESMFKR